jgi:hypothetical protein
MNVLKFATCVLWLYKGADKPDQEGNKLQRQILIFIYSIYTHKWRNITICVYNKTSIKRNILTIKQNTSGSKSD